MKKLGWFKSEENGVRILRRISNETDITLRFDPVSCHLTIDAIGDLEHHVREDVAIVAKRFAPH